MSFEIIKLTEKDFRTIEVTKEKYAKFLEKQNLLEFFREKECLFHLALGDQIAKVITEIIRREYDPKIEIMILNFALTRTIYPNRIPMICDYVDKMGERKNDQYAVMDLLEMIDKLINLKSRF